MSLNSILRGSFAAGLLLALAASVGSGGDGEGWTALIDASGFEAWKEPTSEWFHARSARIDPRNPRRLVGERGDAALIINGGTGNAENLLTKESFGDLQFHCEFMVPVGSNSGVKFAGLYEIQIADSWGVSSPTASDCGGIYPRAELKPKYHHIDKGIPPRVNASRKAGEWQTLDVTFIPPRFDPNGKKRANARFAKVVLNGKVIHENVQLETPTGDAWHDKENQVGPILLQGDHGPVAFRDLRVRPEYME
jgi:hypothetical protein